MPALEDHCLDCVSDAVFVPKLELQFSFFLNLCPMKAMNSLIASKCDFSRSHTTLPNVYSHACDQNMNLWLQWQPSLQALGLLFSRGGKRFSAALILFHQSSFGKYSGDILFLMVEQL